MPNVPRVPGVPNLSSFSDVFIPFLIADVLTGLFGAPAPVWGIYLDGEAIIAADNVISFDFRQDFPISDYPVEQGGFQSYDKVQLPAEIKISFSRGGSIADRQDFLNSIDQVINTTDLYDVVTPEQIYVGYNFTHRDFRRRAQNGVGLITVDLWLTEVRETTTSSFTNTQQPGEAGQTNTGNVQPQSPASSFDESGFLGSIQ